MYTTPDCQATTPLQVPVAVVVGEAAPLVVVVVCAVEEVVVGAACVDDPAQALTAILLCE